MSERKRILIVGGVAGGASCAARARRLSEKSQIIVFDRGPYVSFANCGLPYYVGNIIKDEEKLLLATPEMFKRWFNIEVRTNSEVLSVDRQRNEIRVKDLLSGSVYEENYDVLVLSPGASPIIPPLPGIDLPGIFTLRTIPDSRKIRDWIQTRNVKRAVVVGGGFIGLEMTENLVGRSLAVTIIEMLPQVMPPLDQEMAIPVHACLTKQGVNLLLGQAVSGFEQAGDGSIMVRLQSGASEPADLVMLCIGVRPENKLAREAGLEIGELGGIRVDDQMRTSDERIYAIGDAVEVRDALTGRWTLFPMAGPANRQGRIAADAIFGRETRFRGVQGTAVCGVCGLTIAFTGQSEKSLRRFGLWDGMYEKIYLHPAHHATYYPGAVSVTLKLIFSRKDGKIIGAQAVGREGVEKRIDVISMAIQKGGTVFDLEEAELCYAPQYGSAKDPVNMAGMIASNVVRGDSPVAHFEDIKGKEVLILDVREPLELRRGTVEGAVNIPLDELRNRLKELPTDKEIWTYCRVGQRAYYALRTLAQSGFNVKNLTGGFLTYEMTSQSQG